MRKDTIIQFVCFITNLEPDDFTPKWESYAKASTSDRSEPVLHQLVTETKKKFRYISQHEKSGADFLFNFMKERQSIHFPEHNVRVIHAGGYIPVQVKRKSNEGNNGVKLIAFVGHNETDVDFYRQLPLYRHLDIYQAYYENCTYGYVMEFFVAESNVAELELLLSQRTGIQTGVYKESLLSHA